MILSLSVMLFACGGTKCEEHVDEDGDSICDVCKEKIEKEEKTLSLIAEDGTVNFTVVLGDGIDADTRFSFVTLQNTLKKLGATLEVIDYDDDEAEGVEVLVGDVTTRGAEYVVDKYSLGHGGYTVRIVNDKIVVAAGTSSAMAEAVEYFIEEILGITKKTEELSATVMSESQNYDYIFTDYDVTSIKIGDNDIRDFVIAVDVNDYAYYQRAIDVQEALYNVSGIHLEIVNIATATPDKAIYIRYCEPDDTPLDSFRAYEQGGNLYIECEYNIKFEKCMETFIAKNITLKEGDIVYKGEIYKVDISYITYEDFGAKGDGITNDFAAIYKAHEEANRSGMPLKINQKGVYRITDTTMGNPTAKTIKIATDVYWGTAQFIIDDKDLTPDNGKHLHDRHVFEVVPETSAFKIDSSVIAQINAQMQAGTLTVGRSSTKLDVGLGYAAMLEVVNSEKRVYIRYGANANTGNVQHELIMVDAEGNIDPKTSFLLDYDKVTDIYVYSINDTPITIEGGIFTTIAPDYNTDAEGATSDYYDRGISVERSNVTLKNITHYVENQKAYTNENPGWDPIPYHGFYSFSNGNNINIINCTMTARAGHGTYDFSVGMCNNLTATGCKMTNFFLPGETLIASVQQGYWGVMGSSYCKNIVFDNCDLTRFDAHAGVYNGKILNSRVALINIIGGGELLIENTEIFYHRIIELRSDYGATWRGDIKIYNCKITSASSDTPIVDAVWSNHDFGYTCYFPNIEIRDLQSTRNPNGIIKLFRTNHTNPGANQRIVGLDDDMHKATLDDGSTNVNRYMPPEYVKVTSNAYGTRFYCPTSDFLKNTVVEGFER